MEQLTVEVRDVPEEWQGRQGPNRGSPLQDPDNMNAAGAGKIPPESDGSPRGLSPKYPESPSNPRFKRPQQGSSRVQ